MPQDSVKIVLTDNQKLVINTISKLRKKGLGYRAIGKRLDLHFAAVYQLLNSKWYPKTPEKEQEILEQIHKEW